jgi:hypothetical protein
MDTMWMKTLFSGLAAAIVMGLVLGWFRYWLGFFVLIQGAAVGSAVAWSMKRFGPNGGAKRAHPGFLPSLGVACLFFTVFEAAHMTGFGLAQPWFDPAGWLGRILSGTTSEYVFGLAATAGVHRGFALGLSGGWWIIFNMVDWAVMFFFFWIMPWGAGHEAEER